MRTLGRVGALLVATLLMLGGVLGLTATSASAAWTELGRSGSQVVYLVCKTPEGGGYGTVWKLTLVMATSPDYSGSATFLVNRGSSRVQTVHLSASNGAWDVKTTYASRWYYDTWDTNFGAGQISTGQGLGYGYGGNGVLPDRLLLTSQRGSAAELDPPAPSPARRRCHRSA